MQMAAPEKSIFLKKLVDAIGIKNLSVDKEKLNINCKFKKDK